MTSEAYIIDIARTPMGRGKLGCSLSSVHPSDLTANLLKELIQRNDIDTKHIDDLILGCVTPVAEQGMNIARIVALLALDTNVPGVQINRMCSLGMQSIDMASQAIRASDYDLIIAGGVEHMGRVPMGMDGISIPTSANQSTTFSDSYLNKFSIKSMGQSAEMIAEKWGLDRNSLDEFSVNSHKKAFTAQENGYFNNEIIPVKLADGSIINKDEGIRASVDMAKMASLPTPFKDGGVVTAASASQITDGAALAVIASKTAVEKYNLKPRAKITRSFVCGSDPEIQLTGPIPAVTKLLAKTQLTIEDFDLIEINEAFASVAIACAKELNVPHDKLNVNGGAIALGHPLGCSGTRILATLINELERRGAKRGLLTMCVGFGQGIATAIELV